MDWIEGLVLSSQKVTNSDISEEGQMVQQPKHYYYNNKDEISSLNKLVFNNIN